MRAHRIFAYLCCSVFLLLVSWRSAQAQDTVTVHTLAYDSIGRAGVYHFPEIDGTTYEKVILQYRMRCHNALVSNQSNRNQGCGEWDYNCETYITDSTKIDSLRSNRPSYDISAWSGGNFPYTNTPTYSLFQRTEKLVGFPSLPEFTSSAVGTGALRLAQPFGSTAPTSRSIYVLTAQELNTAGVKTGALYGITLNVGSAGSNLHGLMIKMRATSATAAQESMTRDTGFTTVYYNTTQLATGPNTFYFIKPFNWDGTSNLAFDISYTNAQAGTNSLVTGANVAATSLTTSADLSALNFSGSEILPIDPSNFNQITNEITLSLWAYGDPLQMPGKDASAFEGADNQNNRQVNAHLPWSDTVVYWDCGGNASGYDRVSKKAPKINVAGRWNHWAFTKNAVTGKMQIFLNGTLWASDTGKRKQITLDKLNLGGAITSQNYYYGMISQFSIWNKALDSTSIKSIMQHGVQKNDPNAASLIAYYKLNEGAGSTLYDSSSHHSVSHLPGYPVWHKVRGNELYTNFDTTSARPVFTLLQSTSTVTPKVTNNVVYDTVIDNPHAIISYALVGDSIHTVDTIYRWLATKRYTYNESGVKIDSANVAATDTAKITKLYFYQRYPQKYEIMSFVTPYGIGLDLGKEGKLWEFDATDYLPILHGWKRLSVERGSTQEELDIRFLFIKGKPSRDVLSIQQIWPMTEENYQTILANDRYEPRKVYLDPAGKAFKLRSMITGHGQEGEFITRNHYITINDSIRYQWEVVKECSANPLYPQGGTWIYTRAGWCPGAPTLLTQYDITNRVKAGDTVTMDYGLVTASGDSRYDPSNQLVTYGAPNFTTDAAIEAVMRPSNRTEYGRLNPACDLPIVVLKNNGSAPLTSANIEYYAEGGPHKLINWSGNLKFLDTAVIVLPIDTISFWSKATANVFHAIVSQPNGGADEYSQNDHYTSNFTQPPIYNGAVVLNFRTNKAPEQNLYELRDMSGNILFTKTDFNASTTYYDSLALPTGCYTLIFRDDAAFNEGENGLSFFAAPDEGTGYARLYQDSRKGKLLLTFNPDFGKYFQYDFTVINTTSAVHTPKATLQRMSLYPNPAHDKLSVELEGYTNEKITMEIIDELGHSVRREQHNANTNGSVKATMNLHHLAAGSYSLRVTTGHGDSSVKQFIVR